MSEELPRSSTYRIEFERSAERVFRRLPRDIQKRLKTAIDALTHEPRPTGCRKISGYANLYRIRIGQWRVSYAVEDQRLIVIVVEVAPRGSAYRNF